MLTPEEHEAGGACLPPNDNLDSLAKSFSDMEEELIGSDTIEPRLSVLPPI